MKQNKIQFIPEEDVKIVGSSHGHIFYRYWKGDSRQVLIYLHGIQSHSEWLIHAGEELSKRGITVYAPDRRGSGRSGFPAGDIRRYHDFLEDLREFIRFVKKHEPGKQIHLAGLCWGARLCVPVGTEKEMDIRSLILLSPGLYPKVDFSPAGKIKIGLLRLIAPRHLFALPLEDSYFTGNPEYLDFINHDKHALRKVTARFLTETLKLNKLARRFLFQLKIPVLVLLAGKDRIVDTAKTKEVFSRLPVQKEIKEYPKSCHTLEFEKNNHLLFDEMQKWLLKWEPSNANQ